MVGEERIQTPHARAMRDSTRVSVKAPGNGRCWAQYSSEIHESWLRVPVVKPSVRAKRAIIVPPQFDLRRAAA